MCVRLSRGAIKVCLRSDCTAAVAAAVAAAVEPAKVTSETDEAEEVAPRAAYQRLPISYLPLARSLSVSIDLSCGPIKKRR